MKVDVQVAPMEGLHEESLEDVEEQLHLLMPELKGLSLSPTLALLDGGFSDWLFKILGVQVISIIYSSNSRIIAGLLVL